MVRSLRYRSSLGANKPPSQQFSRKNSSTTAFETQHDEEREIGFAKDEEERISKFRLRQVSSPLDRDSSK